jgi:hypothetical protein
MKLVLNYKRASFFKRLLDQHPEQRRFFFKDFTVEFEETDEAECPVVSGCTVKRSTLPVPLPIRSDIGMFDFVGSADKSQPYGYATPEQLSLFTKYNKYTASAPKYYYTNGYLYIYNADDVTELTVRGIYPDPRQLHDFQCNGEPCYTDDDPYEIPHDLINDMIRDVLQTELRNLFPQNIKPVKEDTNLNDENNRT